MTCGAHGTWTRSSGGLLLAAWAYRRGQTSGPRRPVDSWRARCFTAALVALGLALLSPLDALSSALASAHMVQHLLLLLVAAPLLALSAPSSAILRGSPLAVRRASGRWRRRLGLTHGNLGVLRHPAAVWLLSVGVLWFWHAAAPYDAALDNELLHVLEHASFLVTAVLFWQVVVGVRGAARVSGGLGVLLVFAMAMQSVFLSVLLTFARTPWYSGYADDDGPLGPGPAHRSAAGRGHHVDPSRRDLPRGRARLAGHVDPSDRTRGCRALSRQGSSMPGTSRSTRCPPGRVVLNYRL